MFLDSLQFFWSSILYLPLSLIFLKKLLLLIQKPLCMVDISIDKILSAYKNSYTRWMNSVRYFIHVDKAWSTAKSTNQSINQNSSHSEQLLIMLAVKYRDSSLIRPVSIHILEIMNMIALHIVLHLQRHVRWLTFT